MIKQAIDAKDVKQKLSEDNRHNTTTDEIGKKGSGMYSRKKGRYVLFLKKQKKCYCTYPMDPYTIMRLNLMSNA